MPNAITTHVGSRCDSLPQPLGRAFGAIAQRVVEHNAQQHHHHDDARANMVAEEARHPRRDQQHQHQGVAEQLDQRAQGTGTRSGTCFIGSVLRQATRGFGLSQPVGAAAEQGKHPRLRGLRGVKRCRRVGGIVHG